MENKKSTDAVLLSINPKWCELISSGKKTVEVRKTKPQLDTPFKCYIYCTKNGSYTYRTRLDENRLQHAEVWNGKVIGEFVCDKIEFLDIERVNCLSKSCKDINTLKDNSCLDSYDLLTYLQSKNGYAWHISDLMIYSKPKELREFCGGCKKTAIVRPPQSWCYVEELR